MNTNIFCDKCGSKLIVRKIFADKYDDGSGQKLYNLHGQCPNYALNQSFFSWGGNGHTCAFLDPWMWDSGTSEGHCSWKESELAHIELGVLAGHGYSYGGARSINKK